MSFSIVLTLKPRLHVAENKGGFARGRNCDDNYFILSIIAMEGGVVANLTLQGIQ